MIIYIDMVPEGHHLAGRLPEGHFVQLVMNKKNQDWKDYERQPYYSKVAPLPSG